VIELPNAIVIYPQKKNVPSYLLCWIPSKYYDQVAINKGALDALNKYYPNGIEVELSSDGFKEAGIQLERKPKPLGKAYLDLVTKGLVPESGMVEVSNLIEYIEQKDQRSKKEVLSELAEKKPNLSHLEEGDLLRKIISQPPMTEGEDEKQVYHRLTSQQTSNDLEE
jgi:hypothetical protein